MKDRIEVEKYGLKVVMGEGERERERERDWRGLKWWTDKRRENMGVLQK